MKGRRIIAEVILPDTIGRAPRAICRTPSNAQRECKVDDGGLVPTSVIDDDDDNNDDDVSGRMPTSSEEQRTGTATGKGEEEEGTHRQDARKAGPQCTAERGTANNFNTNF